jgi:hypothetical protein
MRALIQRKLPTRPNQLAEDETWGNERWELLVNCWDVEPSQRPTSRTVFDRVSAIVISQVAQLADCTAI